MQVPVQIKGLPIHLICHLPSHCVAFTPTHRFKAIYETCEGYNVVIDEDGLKFTTKDLASSQSYEYNSLIEWRDDKTLISWLKAQELVMPTFTQPNF